MYVFFMQTQNYCPEILSPAGDTASFLAALAAGADAIYVGLKHFSARMQAENFSLTELAAMSGLAKKKQVKLYIAMNALLKPADLESAGRLIERLAKTVTPNALIIQDVGLVLLARQAGFEGEIHLSTLANLSHPQALIQAKEMGANRVVLPRELNVDEIKNMAEACPAGLDLEVFVHGALCYNISGRCYWSTFLGGKSGLRGRCVQPCRREYTYRGKKSHLFSCQDLSLDVLTKALTEIPAIKAWKIEGRKKGAHYVFYTTKAYTLLRDKKNDPTAKKTAQSLLEQSLGRNSNHAGFLPQRPFHPVDLSQPTGSGLLVARTGKNKGQRQYINPRTPLLKGDLLRLGTESDPWHQTIQVQKATPKGGRLDFRATKGHIPKPGTPVFLIDRREPELMNHIASLQKELKNIKTPQPKASSFIPALPKPAQRTKAKIQIINLNRQQPKRMFKGAQSGLWLAPKTTLTRAANVQWWLPPVIWPLAEKLWSITLAKALKAGAKEFVLGAPWQIKLFQKSTREKRKLRLWAGPFCNIANALTLQALHQAGFFGAIVSPELAKEDVLALPKQSPIPLGFLSYGLWPLGISRLAPNQYKAAQPLTSPKGEVIFSKIYGEDSWIYPNWIIDLRSREQEMARAGYNLFVHVFESLPKTVPQAPRISTFNWELKLL